MKILAVTCYTGDEELCDMTARMLVSLYGCYPKTDDFRTSVVAQGAKMKMTFIERDILTVHKENVGFAFGMNEAVEHGLRSTCENPDYVLCLNNDLEFPRKNWLRKLIDIAEQTTQVLVPATDSAAIRIQPGPLEKPSFPIEESSAYCWLVPFAWCKFLKETYGFWLFDEDFAPAYGEDNWTAFLLSKQFGERVFRYVPRSFVKHLRARTSRTVKHDRAQSNRVLVDKLTKELSDPGLRDDLRKRAKGLISILSKRL